MSTSPQDEKLWIRLRRLIFRWLISTLAIFAATMLIPGISFAGPGWQLGLVAIVFGLVNALLRPLLTLLTCPMILVTFGLFSLVINAGLLILTAQIATSFHINFNVTGFLPALGGAIVISIVTLVLSALLRDPLLGPNISISYRRIDKTDRH